MLAVDSTVTIPLLDGYFTEQFELNTTSDAMKYWQVYDRTTEEEVPREMICRAEYNCIELPEIVRLKGIEDLADHIAKVYSMRV